MNRPIPRPFPVRACAVRLALLLGFGAALGCAEDEPLDGYWVWSREVEDGATVLTITDDDMAPAVGPAGWPDCPDGILCTRWGIRKLHLAADGTLHYVLNVHTSSDFQYRGTYSASGDRVAYAFARMFSCAHPNQTDAERREGGFVFREEGDELWASVGGFDSGVPFAAPAVGTEPSRWLVFRRVSAEEYENRYTIRLCQPVDGFECDPACFPERLGLYD